MGIVKLYPVLLPKPNYKNQNLNNPPASVRQRSDLNMPGGLDAFLEHSEGSGPDVPLDSGPSAYERRFIHSLLGIGKTFGKGRRKRVKETAAPHILDRISFASKYSSYLSAVHEIKDDEEYDSGDDISVALGVFQDTLNSPFKSKFAPEEMRCLALVAHNHMKPAMKTFIETHSEILKKFRLVGTNTTMSMCKTIFGENNPLVQYGPQCTSGPLGGDAQLCALMCLEDVGGVIFFIDPLSAHPHRADIDSLIRLCNVHNVLLCCNPTSGVSTMHLLRCALEEGKKEKMASFFETLESPSVPEYKAAQARALAHAVAS